MNNWSCWRLLSPLTLSQKLLVALIAGIASLTGNGGHQLSPLLPIAYHYCHYAPISKLIKNNIALRWVIKRIYGKTHCSESLAEFIAAKRNNPSQKGLSENSMKSEY